MQVGFGDVWKQSLSELSGGQRSLLALSLILAMLLFKPAPIYILDEVCLEPMLMDNAVAAVVTCVHLLPGLSFAPNSLTSLTSQQRLCRPQNAL